MANLAELKAVIGVDTAAAIYNLKAFGGAFDTVKSGFETALDPLKNALMGVSDFIGTAFTGAVNLAKQTLTEAFSEVKQFEMLEVGMRQLVASQILQGDAATDMTDALVKAEQPTQDFLHWIEQMALKSAYGVEGVSQMARQVMAFGFGLDETKRFTSALIDFATAAGVLPEGLQRISMSLGQMVARGKITGEEFRELSRQMIPMQSILAEELGMSVEELSATMKGDTVEAGVALEALVGWMERTYEGARLLGSTTFQGMTESVGDIKALSLRNIFTGAFEAFKPEAAQILDYLSGEEFQGKLKGIGTGLSDAISAGLTAGKAVIGDVLAIGPDTDLGKFIETIKGGDFTAAMGQIVGFIEFNALRMAAHVKTLAEVLWEVGKFIGDVMKEFLARLGGLIELFSNVIKANVDAFSVGINPLASRGAKATADTTAIHAEETLSYYLDDITGNLAALYEGLQARTEPLLAQRDEALDKIETAEGEYWEEIQLSAELRAKEQKEAQALAAAAARAGGAGRAQYEAEIQGVLSKEGAFVSGMSAPTDAEVEDIVEETKEKLATAAAKPSGTDVEIAKNLMSGVASGAAAMPDIDAGDFMTSFMTSISANIAASGQMLVDAGVSIWNGISQGIVAGFNAGAATDTTFKGIIEGMVNTALAGVLTE